MTIVLDCDIAQSYNYLFNLPGRRAQCFTRDKFFGNGHVSQGGHKIVPACIGSRKYYKGSLDVNGG